MDSRKPERTEMQARDEKSNKDDATVVEMTRDEYTLAKLGYRQVFVRSFGLFENVGVLGLDVPTEVLTEL